MPGLRRRLAIHDGIMNFPFVFKALNLDVDCSIQPVAGRINSTLNGADVR